jgi:hypothetical protein
MAQTPDCRHRRRSSPVELGAFRPIGNRAIPSQRGGYLRGTRRDVDGAIRTHSGSTVRLGCSDSVNPVSDRRKRAARFVPDQDSIIRYCSPGTLDEAMQVTSAAFIPRVQDNGKLSATWLECVSPAPLPDSITAVRTILRRTVAQYTADGRLARLVVGRVRLMRAGPLQLRVKHRPSSKNKCHSVIVTGEDPVVQLEFAEQLATMARSENYRG